jgi:dihydrofolate synthase/folylpolyglutamate synthase
MADPRTLDEWLEYISSVHPKDMDLGLERVAAVASTLGVSQPAASVVTIAGTNGKGSTTAALEAILSASGLKVGATFSPHLSRFNERIRLRGDEAADEQICHAFAAVKAASGETPLTYFEFAALAALYLFRQSEVDVALLEIGLGGRLDAFNLVDADVAVVTSIGLDHQDYLGDDLESIGREKAGIFRASRPVVLGAVTESVHQAALELDCPRLRLGEEIRVERSAENWCYHNDAMNLSIEQLAYGSFAPDNCALALTAACVVLEQRRLPFEPAVLAQALATTRLAGRMEGHDYRGSEVVLDVAHNPAAAEFLAAELEQRWPERRYVAIYGALADKDAVAVLAALEPLVLHWLLVPTFGWRGQTAEQLAARLEPGTDAEICASMADALHRAHSLTAPGNGILAFGSFSAVEQARELLIDPRQQTDDGWSDGE